MQWCERIADEERSFAIYAEDDIRASLDRVQAQSFLVDGEITDSCFYVWDLLSVEEADLRVQRYEIRYVHLTQRFRGVSDVLRVCETAMTTNAVYLLDENRQRFIGTVGVPDRYRLPKEGEIVEVQYFP
jgi:hypothetical protein